jgi:hypothetical protein
MDRRQFIQASAALPALALLPSVALGDEAKYGIFSGYQKIDEASRGLLPGELWVHTSPSGHGRGTFLLNVAYNMAARYEADVTFHTLELSPSQLIGQIWKKMTSSPAPFLRLGITDGWPTWTPVSARKVVVVDRPDLLRSATETHQFLRQAKTWARQNNARVIVGLQGGREGGSVGFEAQRLADFFTTSRKIFFAPPQAGISLLRVSNAKNRNGALFHDCNLWLES